MANDIEGLVDEWRNDNSMTAIDWLHDIEDIARSGHLNEMFIFKNKIKGVMLAWYERWRLEGGTRDWRRLKEDFPEEARRHRTADTTMAEILEIKQKVGEPTPNYQTRMECSIKLLSVSLTEEGVPYEIVPQVERIVSQVFCRGLLPGHPFRIKNKDSKKTLALTYTAVAKYGEPTFESMTRNANPSAYTLPLAQSLEYKGVKIEAAKLAEFMTEFDKAATEQLSMDELVDMIRAWQLSSLEEHTAAGRAMRTVGYMNPIVARRVFGGTMLAKHIHAAPTGRRATGQR
ncbi:hypothetical protein BGZ96_011309 [Linnemannia gamsii]|uniref:Retrotransposon gag domain-containing protein n=1 Tax=Linnemannia gamsii TaxID=64522 RepID=A0ABQ7JSU5_9FUNG|nr:hypothetical protein BGZ96_011309 [Linnemannia gamsii]